MRAKFQFITKFFVGLCVMNSLYSQECPSSDTLLVSSVQNFWPIPNQNLWENIEVMTWNLKDFPLSNGTVNNVQEVIADVLPDIIAFQEVDNLSAYIDLANSLPSYEFISSGTGLGFAARRDVVEIINQSILFSNMSYEFAGRPPLKVELQWSCGILATSLSIVVIHLKSGSDNQDAERRYASCEELESYIDSRPSENIIVLGDFNDEIFDPENINSLWPMVNSSSIQFTTESIANIDYFATYPSWPSFIDHILVSELLFDLVPSGSIKTLLLDHLTGYDFYQSNISDHRPVIWSFPLEEIQMAYGLVINEIMQNPSAVSDGLGEWIEMTNISESPINIDGLVLKDSDSDYHLINSDEDLIIMPNQFLVLGINNDPITNGGVQIDYMYENFFLNNSWDEVIVAHPSGEIIDEVYFDNGVTFPDPSGSSMQLIDPNLDNYLGSNWNVSTFIMDSGDFGSPGLLNTIIDSCSDILAGDINSDLSINVLDIVLIVQFILDQIDFSEIQLCQADFNSDTSINILDIVLLVDFIITN